MGDSNQKMNGVIVVDKPAGWTSHDVVNKVRRIAGTKKVGHLGTLDPLATGVLPLVVGRATRLAQFFTKNDKLYEGVIHFGYSTDSYDSDGAPTSAETPTALNHEQVERALAPFRGTFEQVPPPVSAKKIAGRPAYELARGGQVVALKPVTVTVHSLDLVSIAGCTARVRVHCSAGTYIRSIANDAGKILGCGAHLQELRRLASGEFTIEQASTLEQLGELAGEDRLAEVLIPAAQLLPEFPVELVDLATAGQIRHGRDFRVSPFHRQDRITYVKAVTQDGELVAIGEARLPFLYHPVLVV